MNLNRTQCKHQKVDWPRPNRQKRKVIRKRKAISHTTTINSIVFGADMMDANRNSASGYIASLSSDYPNTPPKDEQAANIHNHRMKNKNKRDTMETFKKRQKHNGKRRNYKMKKRKQMNSSNYGPPIKKRKLNRRMLNSAEKNLDYENDADDDNTEIDESIHSIRKKYKESRQKEPLDAENVSVVHEHSDDEDEDEDDDLFVSVDSVPQLLADKNINAFGIQKIWNALPMITK